MGSYRVNVSIAVDTSTGKTPQDVVDLLSEVLRPLYERAGEEEGLSYVLGNINIPKDATLVRGSAIPFYLVQE